MIEYYTIAVIAILAAISPGPDFVIVTKNALTHDRRSGVFSSIGIGVGILIHSVYCVLGLAIVISQSLLLFSLIKYLGASYLIYLGVKSLLTKKNHFSEPVSTKHTQRSNYKSFRDGLLTNILNPKCTLFMLSVFTLIVKPHTPLIVQAIYGIEIALITGGWFVFLSYGLTINAIYSRIKKAQHAVSKLMGAVLVALGIAVIFESR